MRRSVLIVFLLALSMAANVLLAAKVWRQPSPPSAASNGLAVAGREQATKAARSHSTATPASGDGSTAPLSWRQLNAGSLADLRQRLEAAGFPRSVIYELVTQEIMRRRGIGPSRREQSLAETPYWRNPTSAPDDEKMKRWLEQFEAGMKEAFGSLGYRYSPSGLDNFKHRFGELPPEKIDRLLTLDHDYNELRRDLLKDATDISEAMQRSMLLDEHQRADMAAILTPEELLEHDYRTSPARSFLTENLHHLGMSEAEYRSLFPAAHKLWEQRLGKVVDPVAARAENQTMLAELNTHARTVLGEARFADYQQAIDPDSDRLNRVAARFDLPLSAAAAAAAARRDITTRADAIRADPALTAEGRAAQLRQLHAEARQRLTTALGPRATEAYVSYDGRWLTQLLSRP